ncbi:hypothetical protein O9929_21450 [Vibrio lentus]|nr:hypothetical protein [Vibrio lentus]
MRAANTEKGVHHVSVSLSDKAAVDKASTENQQQKRKNSQRTGNRWCWSTWPGAGTAALIIRVGKSGTGNLPMIYMILLTLLIATQFEEVAHLLLRGHLPSEKER